MATISQAFQAKNEIEPRYTEIVDQAPADKAVEARRLATSLSALQQRINLTRSNRHIVNFEFWRDRSESGATDTNVAARKHLFEAKQLFAKPDLEGAKAKFEQSFKEWAEIFDKWPTQREDADNDELVASVESYIKVLEQLDLRDEDGGILPADFPLTELMRNNDKENLLKFRKEPNAEGEDKPDADGTPPESPEKKPGDKDAADDAGQTPPDAGDKTEQAKDDTMK